MYKYLDCQFVGRRKKNQEAVTDFSEPMYMAEAGTKLFHVIPSPPHNSSGLLAYLHNFWIHRSPQQSHDKQD